jgi:carbamoylphosphate synthase large subunit
MSDFHDRLSAMIAKEATQASKAPDRAERLGDMIEGLARGLGFTVAVAANGNAETIDVMISGAERYALEEAADKAPFAQFMAAMRPANPPQPHKEEGG